jgi:hypothetical protein
MSRSYVALAIAGSLLSISLAQQPAQVRSLDGGKSGAIAAVDFPLKVGPDRRHLVDEGGRPFLVVGDTPWSLIADLKEEDLRAYLDDRSRRGFNAIIVNLIEHRFSTDPPRTRAGLAPFTSPGDFSTPNPAYFDFAHKVIGWAGERGISVWLCPAYLGWRGGSQGFFKEIDAGGADKLKSYGRFLGSRFKDCDNIVWMVGGDYAVPKQHHWTIIDLAEAIRAGGAKQLMTVHGGVQSAVDVVGEQAWIDVNNTYSYDDEIFRVYRKDYGRRTLRPFVLIESTYENEHDSKPEQIRRQAYWALTCGACGQFFGNNPIWHFDGPGLYDAKRSWREELDGVGSRDIARLRSAFEGRPWHELVPDSAGAIVTSGVGEGVGTITASAAPDGKLAMIYVPSTGRGARELSVDLKRFTGPIAASWFNPTDGSFRPAADNPLENSGSWQFQTPGDNGTNTNDWLLVLEVKS